MAKRNNSVRSIIERILKDAAVRTGITTRSLLWFLRVYLSEYVRYETAPFQHEIMRVAERVRHEMVAISAFRGSSKSTIVTTAYVLWSILGKQQRKFVVILSQTEDKARMHLTNLKRELEENDLLKRDLGPFQEESNQWGAHTLLIPKFNAKITIGAVEKSIRGYRHNSRRPDLLVIDDPETIESTKTKEGRQKTWDWFTGDVLPTRDHGTRVFVLGNLLIEGSLLETLRRQIRSGERDGVYLEFPIADDEGNPTWPGKFPTSVDIDVERRKIGDDISWAREFMLKIVAPDDQIIRKEWITRYATLPTSVRYYAVGIDLAISEEEGRAYTAMVSAAVTGFGDNQRIYILPSPVNKRLTFLETMKTAEILSRTIGGGYMLAELYVEKVAYQQSAVEFLKSRGLPTEGVPVYGSDKHARLMSVSRLVQDKKVLFPEKGCEDLIEQLVGFGREKYKDLSDAFAILLQKVDEKNVQTNGFMQMVEEDLAKRRKDGTIPRVPKPLKQTLSITDMLLAIRRGFGGQFL